MRARATLERNLSTTNQAPINQTHPRGNSVYEVLSGGGKGRSGEESETKKKGWGERERYKNTTRSHQVTEPEYKTY